jgi:hypothetical protein
MTRLGHSQANIATQALGFGPRVVLGVLALALVAMPALESGAQTLDRVPDTAQTVVAEQTAASMLIENRRMLSYPIEQVWPTAIRYLRIDRGFEIVDRDQEAGYLMFEFPLEEKRIGSGSLEMFEAIDASGRASVSMSVNTGAGPVHLPNSILDGIAAKVRAERGQPAPPPPPKQEEPPKKKDDPEDDHSVPLLPPATDPESSEFE